MTKSQILDQLAHDPWLAKTIRNITKGSGLDDDIQAELFIILGGKADQYIIQAHERQYLRFMVVKIIQTMHSSPRHPFFQKYRAKDPNICRLQDQDQDLDGSLDPYSVSDDSQDLDQLMDMARRDEAIRVALADSTQVVRLIWEKYQETCSGKAVASFYGVPYSYIRRQLKSFKEKTLFIYINHDTNHI